jgi:hypothetical protein
MTEFFIWGLLLIILILQIVIVIYLVYRSKKDNYTAIQRPLALKTSGDQSTFTISWQYGKKGDTFVFFGDPVVSPNSPPSLALGVNPNIQKIGDITVNGSLLVADANNANKYNVVITMKPGHKGFARGLIPYAQVVNKTQNDIDFSFRDQSDRRVNPIVSPGKATKVNMETGVQQSTEIGILIVGGVLGASAIIGVFAYWFLAGAEVAEEEAIPLIADAA